MITPIYKSGQKLDLCDYKSISLLSVLSKLFEKIVHDQVSMFMKENGLFSNCQHGFRLQEERTILPEYWCKIES